MVAFGSGFRNAIQGYNDAQDRQWQQMAQALRMRQFMQEQQAQGALGNTLAGIYGGNAQPQMIPQKPVTAQQSGPMPQHPPMGGQVGPAPQEPRAGMPAQPIPPYKPAQAHVAAAQAPQPGTIPPRMGGSDVGANVSQLDLPTIIRGLQKQGLNGATLWMALEKIQPMMNLQAKQQMAHLKLQMEGDRLNEDVRNHDLEHGDRQNRNSLEERRLNQTEKYQNRRLDQGDRHERAYERRNHALQTGKAGAHAVKVETASYNAAISQARTGLAQLKTKLNAEMLATSPDQNKIKFLRGQIDQLYNAMKTLEKKHGGAMQGILGSDTGSAPAGDEDE